MVASISDLRALGLSARLGERGRLDVTGQPDVIRANADAIRAAKPRLIAELQAAARRPLAPPHPGLFLSDPALGEVVDVPACPRCGSLDAWQALAGRAEIGEPDGTWRCRRCDPPGFRKRS